IYNGVDLNISSAKLLPHRMDGIPQNKFIIGTTSRFIFWKRVDYLIKAFYQFQKGKDDAILLLVGDGPDMTMLKELVKELDIIDKVIFAGYKKNVQNYQSIMDVCVFPSKTETFGLVAIECLNLGKPVLVFNDGGGITELVEMIEPNNICDSIKQMVEKLNQYHSFELSIENMEKRKRFAEKFSITICSENFENLYKSL
ncbi:MAG: glycosyltransferase family 4 protein, partial [Leeuwenhoekiella sp.]